MYVWGDRYGQTASNGKGYFTSKNSKDKITSVVDVYREVTEYNYSGGVLIGFQISRYLDNSKMESCRIWLLYDETGDLIWK